jgi:hypothetical protein
LKGYRDQENGNECHLRVYTQQGDEKGYLFTVGDEPFRIEVCRGVCDQTSHGNQKVTVRMTPRGPFTIFKQQKCINDEEPQKGGEKKSGNEAVDEGDGI